ncbi:MAG: amino acid racemase [Erysipelotrichaceae bacterium]
MNDKKIGIIGGMGPEATAYYYTQMIKLTGVHKDQDHFRVYIDSNVKVPDRTAAILGKGPSPVPYILETIAWMNQVGVDEAFIPCFTSHYFFDEYVAQANFKLHNAFTVCNEFLKNELPDVKKVGVLATTGTRSTQIFDKYLTGVELIYPSEKDQEEKVMKAIYDPKIGIKGGKTDGECIVLLVKAADALIAQGAQCILAGCTEIGLVLRPHHLTVPLVDPMLLTVLEIIQK